MFRKNFFDLIPLEIVFEIYRALAGLKGSSISGSLVTEKPKVPFRRRYDNIGNNQYYLTGVRLL